MNDMHDPSHHGAEDLIPTRSSLLGRLKDWDDKESWRAFFETYWKLIYSFAKRRGLSHEESQDVVQDTVLAVAKSISRFEYDPKACAFKTWLLGVTRSKIANQYARRAKHPTLLDHGNLDDNTRSPALDRVAELHENRWEESWDEEWQKNLMDTAIQQVKQRVSIEQYQMFDLFVLKQWRASEVARTLGVTIGHVYVAKHRVAKLIRQQVQLLEDKIL
jgi:RNA polymerase sigma factor (sigma-70 family)